MGKTAAENAAEDAATATTEAPVATPVATPVADAFLGGMIAAGGQGGSRLEIDAKYRKVLVSDFEFRPKSNGAIELIITANSIDGIPVNNLVFRITDPTLTSEDGLLPNTMITVDDRTGYPLLVKFGKVLDTENLLEGDAGYRALKFKTVNGVGESIWQREQRVANNPALKLRTERRRQGYRANNPILNPVQQQPFMQPLAYQPQIQQPFMYQAAATPYTQGNPAGGQADITGF